jgi:hypothetical protein
MAEPREVTSQLWILLASRVEQDLKAGQSRRERPGVRASVMHAV